MFRILVITGIIFYVIYKIGSLFFRAGAASQALRDQERRNFESTRPSNPPVKPKRGPAETKKGDYIDYEEVK